MIGTTQWKYLIAGHSARPLVLLPGEELFAEYWFRLISAMQSTQQILAITLPALNSIASCSDGLSDLLDSLGIHQVDLLGSALGGCIAQEFVRRYPARVRRLVLANSYEPGCRTPRLSRLYQQVNPLLPLASLRVMKKQHLLRLVTGTGRESPFWRGLSGLLYERYLSHASKDLLLAPVRSLADFSHYRHYGSRDLVDWPGRVMIIESIQNPSASARCQARLRMLYPQASVTTLSNSGHTPGYSMPVDFSVLIGSFLQRS